VVRLGARLEKFSAVGRGQVWLFAGSASVIREAYFFAVNVGQYSTMPDS
jgi:hypothetical protein